MSILTDALDELFTAKSTINLLHMAVINLNTYERDGFQAGLEATEAALERARAILTKDNEVAA